MQTIRQNLKDYLDALDTIIIEAEERCEKYRLLYERSVKTTTQLTGMPGGSGTDRDALLASVSDARSNIEANLKVIESCKNKIKEVLTVPQLTPIECTVIMARHFHNRKWKEIIAQNNKSERQIYRIYKSAFDKCAIAFNHGMPEN